MKRLAQQEGVTSYPGNDKFFLGMARMMRSYLEEIKSEPNVVQPNHRLWLLDKLDGVKGRFDGEKYPLVVINRMSYVFCLNSDPQVAHDMLNSKNKIIEKTTE